MHARRRWRSLTTKGASIGQPRRADARGSSGTSTRCKGVPVDNVWDDIPPINSQATGASRLPDAEAACPARTHHQGQQQPNDIVLDAFCGCGTALVAAENLGRQWIGIDISPTACRVMAKRLRDVCKHPRGREPLADRAAASSSATCRGPRSKLRKIPPFEFENWAVIALGGIPNKAQVGDMGIDGRIYPVSAMPAKARRGGRRTRLHGRLVSRSRSSRRTKSAGRTSTPSRPS